MAGAPYVIIALLSGIATGVIGRAKGSSFFIWSLVGLVLPILGLVAVILYRGEQEEPERRRISTSPTRLRSDRAPPIGLPDPCGAL
jgi:hypothetical protein